MLESQFSGVPEASPPSGVSNVWLEIVSQPNAIHQLGTCMETRTLPQRPWLRASSYSRQLWFCDLNQKSWECGVSGGVNLKISLPGRKFKGKGRAGLS